MRSRALQLGLLVALGGALGLLLTRSWREPSPAPTLPAPTVELDAPAVSSESKASTRPAGLATAEHELPPPAAREFKLPAMRPPTAASPPAAMATRAGDTTPKRPDSTVIVPKNWLLRGTSPQSYDMMTDRTQVHSGAASVLIRSHDKNISPALNGSVLQAAVAESLLGKRVELSAFLRAEDVRERTVGLWFMATDSNNLLLASETSRTEFPKIMNEWTRVRLVVDVPWSAAQVSYGATLAGKGALWIDDLRLTTVDRAAMALTSTTLPRQLGQPVSPPGGQGPLPRPENLDFEETMAAEATLRDKPPESLTEIRN
jgi:hypothetical protein